MRIKSERLIKKYRNGDGRIDFLCPSCGNYTCCYDEGTDEPINTAVVCEEYELLP